MPEWLAQLGAGLFVAVVTALVTVRLSLNRFRSERWWERKVEAYSDILNALSDLHRYAELLAKENLGSRFSEDHRQELSDHHADAHHRLKRATIVGGFVISDKVARVLELVREHGEAFEYHDGPPWEYYEDYAKLYAGAIRDIRSAAKADLGV